MFIGEPSKWTTAPQRLAQQDDILMSVRAPVGPVNFATQEICIGRGLAAIRPKAEHVLGSFAFYVLRSLEPEITGDAGAAFASINKGAIEKIEIPLPPLEVQREIVAEIEGYQRVIDGARAVIDNYRPHIPINPEWPMVELGQVCKIGGSVSKAVDGLLPYFGADSIESDTGKIVKVVSAQAQGVNGPVYGFSGERLLYSKIRPYLNKLAIVDLEGYCSSDMYPLLVDGSRVQTTYLANYMLSEAFNDRIKQHYERASIPKINRAQLFQTTVPLPPLQTQKAIVDEIDAEQSLVNTNQELIERFEKKIQAAIGRVWGDGKHG